LFPIQQDLVILMGELATVVEDLPRYVKEGYTLVTSQMTVKLDKLIRELESQDVSFKGWATPGANPTSASLDVARTVCRRAERRVCALQEAGQLQNAEIIIYLNRLADLLWLFARCVETQGKAKG
jgi:cob(I)alamin adenosyltransferase